jgi:hypothetical protein
MHERKYPLISDALIAATTHLPLVMAVTGIEWNADARLSGRPDSGAMTVYSGRSRAAGWLASRRTPHPIGAAPRAREAHVSLAAKRGQPGKRNRLRRQRTEDADPRPLNERSLRSLRPAQRSASRLSPGRRPPSRSCPRAAPGWANCGRPPGARPAAAHRAARRPDPRRPRLLRRRPARRRGAAVVQAQTVTYWAIEFCRRPDLSRAPGRGVEDQED